MLAYIIYGLTAIVVIVFMVSKNGRNNNNFPPGPATTYGLGHLLLLYKNPALHLTFHELGKKFNGIFGLQLGGHNVLVLTNHTLIREACVTQDHVFSDRPTQLDYYTLLNKGNGFVLQNGENFKILKRFCMKWLKQTESGNNHLTRYEIRVSEEIPTFLSEVNKLGGGKNPTAFSIDKLLYRLVSNPMCSSMFGHRFDYNDEQYEKLLDSVETISREGGPSNPFVFLPKWTFFLIPLIQPNAWSMKSQLEIVRNFIRQEIKEHQRTFIAGQSRDIIDLFLKEITGPLNTSVLSDVQMESTIIDLVFASTENLQNNVSWSILLLMKNPEVQTKCREEILKVVGKDKMVTYNDRHRLPYLEATMYEIMRIATTAGLSLPHNTKEATSLGGYHIPKDTIVYVCLYSPHHDETQWTNPEQFTPERFLDTEGCVRKMDAFMPFMIGKRGCLGENVAKIQLFVTLGTLLQNMEFESDPEHELGGVSDARLGITLSPPPYKLRAWSI